MSSFQKALLRMIFITLVANGCRLATNKIALEPCVQIPFIEPIDNVSSKSNFIFGYFSENSLYITNIDRTNNTLLANEIFPYWSPDNQKIAYMEANEICIADSDGSHILQITNDKLLKSDISWSPSGEYIVFVVNHKDEKDLLGSYYNGEIYIATIDGEVTQLTYSPDSSDNNPTWSPDGKMIAFDSYSNPVDTGGYIEYTISISILNLANHQSNILATDGLKPVWFPDGKQLLFESVDDQICKIDVQGQNSLCITSGFYDYAPQFSPDGQHIAFTRADGDWSIYTMKPDGSEQTWLANGIYPTWSPDGNYIAFGTGGDNPDFYVINTDGTNLTPLAKNAWFYTWVQP